MVLFMNEIIIDVDDEVDYVKHNLPNSINIPYNKLISNHKIHLNKDNYYKIVCKVGNKSKKATAILKVYGYNVTKISK